MKKFSVPVLCVLALLACCFLAVGPFSSKAEAGIWDFTFNGPVADGGGHSMTSFGVTVYVDCYDHNDVYLGTVSGTGTTNNRGNYSIVITVETGTHHFDAECEPSQAEKDLGWFAITEGTRSGTSTPSTLTLTTVGNT